MEYYEEEQRQKRTRRRKVLDDWKEYAEFIREAAESKQKKILRREARREALAMMEDAARTSEDFEKIIIIWDRLERNEEERIADHEALRTNELLDWELTEKDVFIPQPIARVYYRQEIKGNFLDTIYDCPHELPETTSCWFVQSLIEELDELKKELLYYRSIRYWSPQQIAARRDQTDRNIRKVFTKMMTDMRYELFYCLYWRYKKHLLATTCQKKFVLECMKKLSVDKEKEVEWELNEGDSFPTDEDESEDDA